jgi:outer membrane protein OmpA-like peptidoglycan-associated protein
MRPDPGGGVAVEVMQPRFAALLFALGLCDLVYVNLGLGPELFASNVDAEAPATSEPRPEQPAPPPEQTGEAQGGEVANVTPAPARRSPIAGGVNPAPPAPAPSVDPLAPPSSANDLPLAPNPAEPPVDPAVAALPGSPDAPSSARPAARREPASEPAARDAVEAGRASAAELALLTADLTVAFPDTASAVLSRAAREELLLLATRLREHPSYNLRIVGHADSRGPRDFNKYLGNRRARAVFELLTAAGVPPEQLDLESRGEDEPAAVGASEEVWAANRRVEISIASERSETP